MNINEFHIPLIRGIRSVRVTLVEMVILLFWVLAKG